MTVLGVHGSTEGRTRKEESASETMETNFVFSHFYLLPRDGDSGARELGGARVRGLWREQVP